MGIQVCSNHAQGSNFNIDLHVHVYRKMTSKIFFFLTVSARDFISRMKHPWDIGIQVCSNEVSGVINGHALRGHSFI